MTSKVVAVGLAGILAAAGALPLLAVLGAAPVTGDLSRPWSGEVVAAPAPDLPDAPAAVRALERAVQAARSTPFTAVAAIQDWGADGGVARLVDVVRVPGEGTLVRVRGADGTVESTRVSTDTGVPTAAPSDSGRVLGLLARNFAVSVGGQDAVAGRASDLVVARRADGRVAARFWLDRETGLVLRREVYDASGRTAQAATFLSLRLAPDGEPPVPGGLSAILATAVAPRSAGATGSDDPPWTSPADAGEVAAMRGHGWACPEALPEGLVLFDVRRGATADGDLLQMIYSDGLATVSLFEQRGHLAEDALEGFQRADVGGTTAWTRAGPPAQVVWESDGSVLTLVADAPADLVSAVVAALPGPDPRPDGWKERVQRGWGRVLDAVLPGR